MNGWRQSNIAEIFSIRKLEPLGYRLALFVILRLQHVYNTPFGDNIGV